MDTFYPFIYEPKAKETEFIQIPLYLELDLPELEEIEKPQEEEEIRVIIVDLW